MYQKSISVRATVCRFTCILLFPSVVFLLSISFTVCGKITIRLRLKQVSIQQLKNTKSSPQWLNQQSCILRHLCLGLVRFRDAFRCLFLLFLGLLSSGILLFGGSRGVDVDLCINLAGNFGLSILLLDSLCLRGRLRVLLH